MTIHQRDEYEYVLSVIDRLTGSIYPVGETYEDEKRYGHLQVIEGLVWTLVGRIEEVALENHDQPESSRKKAGISAMRFLEGVRDRLDEAFPKDAQR